MLQTSKTIVWTNYFPSCHTGSACAYFIKNIFSINTQKRTDLSHIIMIFYYYLWTYTTFMTKVATVFSLLMMLTKENEIPSCSLCDSSHRIHADTQTTHTMCTGHPVVIKSVHFHQLRQKLLTCSLSSRDPITALNSHPVTMLTHN